jgi:protein O-mannosyl-transferase
MMEYLNLKSGLQKYRILLICAFLTGLTLLVYWHVQFFDFIDFDDNIYILENSHVQTGLTARNILWSFKTTDTANWHPLTWLSLMVDFNLYKLNPAGYHWTNLLIHIANALLLFAFLQKTTKEIWKSTLVAVIFSIHPLNIESVAWIAERKNVLSTFFWLLTMLVYVFYREAPSLKRYMLVVLTFVLGLMTKPFLVTLPFILILLDYWPLQRISLEFSKKPAGGYRWRDYGLMVEKLPLIILAALSCVITLYAAQEGGAIKTLQKYPLDTRFLNALISYMMYLKRMIWPYNLAIFYPHEEITSFIEVAAACSLISIITIFVLFTNRRWRYLFVGWFWYLGTMVPVIGLIQVGFQSMADRYAYVPLIGIFIMSTWGLSDLFSKFHVRRVLVTITALMVVAFFVIASWQQLQNWKNSMTVFQHALKVTKKNYQAHLGIGNDLILKGNIQGALSHYQDALRFNPDHPDVRNNYGNILMGLGKYEEALDQYQRSLRIKPNQAKVYNNMGVLFAKKGGLDIAIEYFQKALMIDPEYLSARGNLKIAVEEKESLLKKKLMRN